MPNAPDARRVLDAFTDAALDTLSVVTPADISDAQRAWRRDAPVAARGWLDATVPTPKEDATAAATAAATADVVKRDTMP